jgi:hypothetical protein
MNKEQIIQMAQVAGCHDNGDEFRFVELRYLERFFQAAYAAGAAAERKRLANKIALMPFGDTAASFAVWIRNGGEG